MNAFSLTAGIINIHDRLWYFNIFYFSTCTVVKVSAEMYEEYLILSIDEQRVNCIIIYKPSLHSFRCEQKIILYKRTTLYTILLSVLIRKYDYKCIHDGHHLSENHLDLKLLC